VRQRVRPGQQEEAEARLDQNIGSDKDQKRQTAFGGELHEKMRAAPEKKLITRVRPGGSGISPQRAGSSCRREKRSLATKSKTDVHRTTCQK